jgi:hypothetical protein
MNATSLPALPVEAAAYVALQREMHDALLRQLPEWMERDGNCPKVRRVRSSIRSVAELVPDIQAR